MLPLTPIRIREVGSGTPKTVTSTKSPTPRARLEEDANLGADSETPRVPAASALCAFAPGLENVNCIMQQESNNGPIRNLKFHNGKVARRCFTLSSHFCAGAHSKSKTVSTLYCGSSGLVHIVALISLIRV